MVARANSRFLHSAFPFGFAQGPDSGRSDKVERVSGAEARMPKPGSP